LDQLIENTSTGSGGSNPDRFHLEVFQSMQGSRAGDLPLTLAHVRLLIPEIDTALQ
jgi:hypothetical protein